MHDHVSDHCEGVKNTFRYIKVLQMQLPFRDALLDDFRSL